MKKQKEWNKKISGTAPYFDEPFYVGFDINGCELGLDPDDLNSVKNGEYSAAYWQVDDIKNAINNLIDNGAKIISAIQEVGGGISVAVAEDPFGNHIGLIEEKATIE